MLPTPGGPLCVAPLIVAHCCLRGPAAKHSNAHWCAHASHLIRAVRPVPIADHSGGNADAGGDSHPDSYGTADLYVGALAIEHPIAYPLPRRAVCHGYRRQNGRRG